MKVKTQNMVESKLESVKTFLFKENQSYNSLNEWMNEGMNE